MDITTVGNTGVRIKGKTASITIDMDKVHVADKLGENSRVVDGPGEYEVKGVGIIGKSVGDTTAYRLEIDGISLLYLTGVVQAPTSAQVETLEGVDILFVTPNDAAPPIVHEIEPSLVIPLQADAQLMEIFLKEMGVTESVPVAKFVISKDKIPEQMQVVVIS